MKLYSYCIPVDDGAAPNPFWGICTLAICKPVIRRTAKIGDWIVGTGSTKFGFKDQLIYTMNVTEIMTFREYNTLCKNDVKMSKKIPDWTSRNIKKKVGDCIYDFDSENIIQRKGVHNQSNIERDLNGKNVLLSSNFYYFGSKPIYLPNNLLPIVHQGQGHKSDANKPFIELFLDWIETLGNYKNQVGSLPYGFNSWRQNGYAQLCSERHVKEDRADERCMIC